MLSVSRSAAIQIRFGRAASTVSGLGRISTGRVRIMFASKILHFVTEDQRFRSCCGKLRRQYMIFQYAVGLYKQ